MENKITTLAKMILTVLLLLGTVFVPVISAGPLLQDPRPDRDGSGGGSAGGAGNGGGSSSLPPAAACASLVGQVINWGSGGEGGVTTNLDAGSWQLTTVSATDGNYGYGGLGIGAAQLHVALTPEQAQRFTPLIQDAGIYLSCDFPLVANIGLFSGTPIEPPATIEISASRTSLAAGQQAEIMLAISNDLPTDITDVVVTSLFAAGLLPVDVSTSAGSETIKIVDTPKAEKLVVVNFNKMSAGEEITINITAVANPELAGTAQVKNTATLFYRESVAHQFTLDFDLEAGALPVQAVAPTPIPSAADSFAAPAGEADTSAPSAVVSAEVAPAPTAETEEGEDFVPPPSMPATGDNFVPPDALPTTGDNFVPPPLLPVTGRDSLEIPVQLFNTRLSLVYLPLIGLGLAGVVIVFLRLRGSHRLRASRCPEASAYTRSAPTPWVPTPI